jgi:hypothetical protein
MGLPLTDLPLRHPYRVICSGEACKGVTLLVSGAWVVSVEDVAGGVVIRPDSLFICKLNSSKAVLIPCSARMVVCTSRNITLPATSNEQMNAEHRFKYWNVVHVCDNKH